MDRDDQGNQDRATSSRSQKGGGCKLGCTPDAQSTSLDWESDEFGQQVETHSHRSSDECVGHLRAHVIDMVAGRRHRRHDTHVADGANNGRRTPRRPGPFVIKNFVEIISRMRALVNMPRPLLMSFRLAHTRGTG